MALSSIQLEAFLAVAQTLNFTKAAERIHITQSALSQRIMKLEEEIETSLFIRDRAGIRLTETAQELVRYCLCKNSLEDEFVSRLKTNDLGGIIRIGGFSSVMQSVILPSLAGVLVQNPKIRIQTVIDELENLPERLHRGEIDYMILTQYEEREDMERILLGHELNVLVQKKQYAGPDVYLDHDEKDRVTFDYLKLVGRRPKRIERHYLDSIYGLIEGVRLGLGRAVIPKHLLKSERDFEIVNPRTFLEVPVYLFYYSQPYYSKLHSVVVEAVTKNARQLLEAPSQVRRKSPCA